MYALLRVRVLPLPIGSIPVPASAVTGFLLADGGLM